MCGSWRRCPSLAARPASLAPPPPCTHQIWAGSKQKELGLGSMQLLHQYVPLAAALLAILVSWGQQGQQRRFAALAEAVAGRCVLLLLLMLMYSSADNAAVTRCSGNSLALAAAGSVAAA